MELKDGGRSIAFLKGEEPPQKLIGNDTKVSRDTLVQLFFLFSSGLMVSRYKYERTGISGSALVIGNGDVNERRANRTEEL